MELPSSIAVSFRELEILSCFLGEILALGMADVLGVETVDQGFFCGVKTDAIELSGVDMADPVSPLVGGLGIE